jgi:glycosyltransferase involved in cell wall biosynthesis
LERTNKLFEGIRIAVVIPHHEFTGRGQEAGGHISHFKGVVKGFIENGCSVTTFARDPNSRCVDIEDSSLHIEVRGLSRVSYLYNLFCELYRVRKSFDLIYIRHSLGAVIFYPFFCLIFRRSEKVVELNSFTSRSAFSLYFEKRSLCFFDKIVAVSERLKESIPSGLQLSAIVVPNGVDLDRFQPKNSKPVLDAGLATVFGFVGTLKPGYGIEKLLAMYLKADFKIQF